MNSDRPDHKNHISPVSPGDNWGDLDEVTEMPQIGLPPRRPDRGIPTKRELNPVSAKRHAPYPKFRDDTQIPSDESISFGSKADAKPATKAARKAPSKKEKGAPKTATKQSKKKQSPDSFGKIRDDAPRKVFEATPSEAHYESGVESDADEKEITLPVTVAHGSKRFRVTEIAPQRLVEKRVQKTPLTISKMAGKRASNEALMQNAISHNPDAISSGDKNGRLTLAWIIGAGAVIISIIVGAILLSRPPEADSEPGKLSVLTDLTAEKSHEVKELKGAESLDMLINGEEQAKVIVATYATSKSVEDFIGIVYLPEKNRELISKDWEPIGAGPGWKPGENCTWTVLEKGGLKYGVLACVLANSSVINAVFRQDGDSLKMDWRATTGYSSAAYAELMKGHGDGAEIRAILSPADFHTFTLPEGEFRCYRLTAPDREANIWAYTKINSANDEKLISQFIPSQLTGDTATEINVVLVLSRGPAQSLPNQWMIGKVMRLSWLDE